MDEDDSWVLSPLKNNKLNSNSQLDKSKLAKQTKRLNQINVADSNDIDSLVEEELSRGRSEDCSVDDDLEDSVGIAFKPASKHASKTDH